MFQQILWDKMISPCMHYLRTCIQKSSYQELRNKMANLNEIPSLPVENVKKKHVTDTKSQFKSKQEKIC